MIHSNIAAVATLAAAALADATAVGLWIFAIGVIVIGAVGAILAIYKLATKADADVQFLGMQLGKKGLWIVLIAACLVLVVGIGSMVGAIKAS